jgi:hypothetical protein
VRTSARLATLALLVTICAASALVIDFRSNATAVTKENYQGVMHTIWTSNENALDQFYGRKESKNENRGGDWVEAFKALFDEIEKLEVRN